MGKIVQVEDANEAKPLAAPSLFHRRSAVRLEGSRARSPHVQLGANARSQAGADAPVGGWSKRAFDICVSLAGIVVLAPLLVLIAIAIRLDSPGPAIFKQDRGGFRGRSFRIYKFRTMTCTQNRGVVQVRNGDARITRLGKFLRSSSWDEFPQLFNVLMGHMSVIGPRPHAVEHDEQFEAIDPRYGVRRSARPGVTGLAQVNGCRGPTETAEKVRNRTAFDAQYVQSWSWLTDLKILAASALILFKSRPDAI